MKPNLAALSDFGNAPESLDGCTFRGRRGGADAAWVGDRRYVMEGNAMTATGVAASVRASLALVNALAGSAAGRNVGADGWSDVHDGSRVGLTARAVATALTNRVTFWRHRTFDWPVANGFDEVPDGAHRRCVGADIAQRCWRNGGCASTWRRGAGRCARRRRGALRRRDVRLGGAATGECGVAAENWRVARREPRFPARKRRYAQAVAVRRAVSRFHSIPERLPLRQYASTGFGSASTSAPNASTSASPIRSRSTGR